MKANELRLGNWVLDGAGRGWCLNKNQFLDRFFWDLVEVGEVKPLPLTKEWILMFGFESDGVTFKVKFNGLRFILFQINASNAYNDNVNEFTVTIYQHKEAIEISRIKHVHQLQNLCLDLTGHELIAKT